MSEKNILVSRAIGRAEGGLYFLDECLNLIHKNGTDSAFSRSIYILLSYNFELILKSLVILSRNNIKKEDLVRGLNHHDLMKLSRELPESDLNEIGIRKIQKGNNNGFLEYEIEMIIGDKIVIQDLIDVRYDFIKESRRNSDPQEAKRIKGEISILLEIAKKINERI